MSTKSQIEREQLQLASVHGWESERQLRADAYAAVVTHLNYALDALPMGDQSAAKMRSELSYSVNSARGALRRVLDETNPFVKSGERT